MDLTAFVRERHSVVVTLAGRGIAGSADHHDGPLFHTPRGVAVHPVTGDVFVADQANHAIRVVKAGSSQILTLVGGTEGYADGPASVAQLSNPTGLAFDAKHGRLIVTEPRKHRVRAVCLPPASRSLLSPDAPVTVMTLVGGEGRAGFADGPADSALLDGPTGVDCDSNGNVVVADQLNHCLRLISATTGSVSTLAGDPKNKGRLDGRWNVAQFNQPTDVAVHPEDDGVIAVADSSNMVVRLLVAAGSPDAHVSTLVGKCGSRGSRDGIGRSARFDDPVSLAWDSAGCLFVTEWRQHTIRKISPCSRMKGAYEVQTVAGTGVRGLANGPAMTAMFSSPWGIAVDRRFRPGDVVVAESGSHAIRKLLPDASWALSRLHSLCSAESRRACRAEDQVSKLSAELGALRCKLDESETRLKQAQHRHQQELSALQLQLESERSAYESDLLSAETRRANDAERRCQELQQQLERRTMVHTHAVNSLNSQHEAALSSCRLAAQSAEQRALAAFKRSADLEARLQRCLLQLDDAAAADASSEQRWHDDLLRASALVPDAHPQWSAIPVLAPVHADAPFTANVPLPPASPATGAFHSLPRRSGSISSLSGSSTRSSSSSTDSRRLEIHPTDDRSWDSPGADSGVFPSAATDGTRMQLEAVSTNIGPHAQKGQGRGSSGNGNAGSSVGAASAKGSERNDALGFPGVPSTADPDSTTSIDPSAPGTATDSPTPPDPGASARAAAVCLVAGGSFGATPPTNPASCAADCLGLVGCESHAWASSEGGGHESLHVSASRALSAPVPRSPESAPPCSAPGTLPGQSSCRPSQSSYEDSSSMPSDTASFGLAGGAARGPFGGVTDGPTGSQSAGDILAPPQAALARKPKDVVHSAPKPPDKEIATDTAETSQTDADIEGLGVQAGATASTAQRSRPGTRATPDEPGLGHTAPLAPKSPPTIPRVSAFGGSPGAPKAAKPRKAKRK